MQEVDPRGRLASDSTALGNEVSTCNVYIPVTLSSNLGSVGWADGACPCSHGLRQCLSCCEDRLFTVALMRYPGSLRTEEVQVQRQTLSKKIRQGMMRHLMLTAGLYTCTRGFMHTRARTHTYTRMHTYRFMPR